MKLAKTDTITPQCLASSKPRVSEKEKERRPSKLKSLTISTEQSDDSKDSQYSKFFLAVLIPLGLILSTILNVLGYQNHSVYAIDCTALSSEELIEKYGEEAETSTPSDAAVALLTQMNIPSDDYQEVAKKFETYADSIDIGTDEQKCDIIEYGNYLSVESTDETDKQSAVDNCAATLNMKILWVLDIGKMVCMQVFSIQDSVTIFMQILGVFMEYRMLVQDSGTNLISSAWSQFLIFANIVFAILFLIVIFSTATSVGLSNYSIKRILPRLILIAIAVNISYYICAAIVDLSNVVGASLMSLFDNIIDNTLAGTSTPDTSVASVMSNYTVAITGILLNASPTFLPTMLIILLIFSIIILLGIIGVFIMLVFRQVMLTLIVIISPLAFACLLLANTESWFKKWLKAFLQLLMIFPILMGLTGACHFVSVIMLLSPVSSSGDFVSQIFGILMSLVLAILPMLLIWPVTKRFSGLAGQLTAKVSSGAVKVGKTAAAVGMTAATMGLGAAAASKAGGSKIMGALKGMGGKVGKVATAFEERAVSGTGMIANSKLGKRVRDRYYRQQIGEQANKRRARQEAISSISDLANSDDDYRSTAYHGEAEKAFKEQVTMEDAKAKAGNQSQEQIETIIKEYKEHGANSGHSRAKVASAIGRWQPKGNEVIKMVDGFRADDPIIRGLLTEKLAATDTGGLTSASMIDDVRKGTFNLEVSIRKKALKGEYDVKKYASTSPDMAKFADEIISSTKVGDIIDSNGRRATQEDVDTIRRNYENLIKTTAQTDGTRAQMTGDATKRKIYERYNSPSSSQPAPNQPTSSQSSSSQPPTINTRPDNFSVQQTINITRNGTSQSVTQDISGREMMQHIHRASGIETMSQQSLEAGLRKLLSTAPNTRHQNMRELVNWRNRNPKDHEAAHIVKLGMKVTKELAEERKNSSSNV